MALLDSIVDAYFRDEAAGRVVVFPWNRRKRGYLVKSGADEQKVRSFLKVFFCAHASILLLGGLLASAWASDLSHILDRHATHALRIGGIFLGIYLLVVGAPYWLLWRSCKQASLSFVSAQDEVSISGKRVVRRSWIAIGAALITFGILILLGAILLIRAK
jgi:hypothetical protein